MSNEDVKKGVYALTDKWKKEGKTEEWILDKLLAFQEKVGKYTRRPQIEAGAATARALLKAGKYAEAEAIVDKTNQFILDLGVKMPITIGKLWAKDLMEGKKKK